RNTNEALEAQHVVATGVNRIARMMNDELGYALDSSDHKMLWFAKALVPCSLFPVPSSCFPLSQSFLRKEEEDEKEEKKRTRNREQGTRTFVRRQLAQYE
ncbi:MAG TPA: hypothetical protein VM223_11600, partial [Planctomycetota bacterium]|nr:hypothetical protein [Planctomycetota bacterium]